MSDSYIREVFDIIDGKLKYSNVDKKKRGRKPGYKHSQETKDKIAEQMRDRVKDPETKEKISRSLRGIPKPLVVRKKISESKKQPKNSIAADLLRCYEGKRKEKDIPVSTAEWLTRCGFDQEEICKWIAENYDEFNKSTDICSESDMKEGFYKGSPIEDEGFLIDDWRDIKQ
jgi:hypothetical protein